MFFFSTDYLLFMIPAVIVVTLAQYRVQSTYNKWSKVRNYYGINGADVAKRLINRAGLNQVSLTEAAGKLTDHYNPRNKTLSLSQAVARGESIASIAIAAHEIGHAQQDREDYVLLRLRAALVPATNIGSTLGWIIILVGLLLGVTQLAWLGVGLFALGSIFALATIPVELNASARAKALLTQSGLVNSNEDQEGVNAVLNAAAFTYIAALAASLLQLLYWVSVISGRKRR